MKKVYKRLQGDEWKDLRSTLTLFKYLKNTNGHIKGFYKDKNGKIYSHWLSDNEILNLKLLEEEK